MPGDINISIASPTLELPVNVGSSGDADDSLPQGNGNKMLGQLRRAICKHQGEIVQAIFLSLEYHKNLRLARENGDPKDVEYMHSLETVSERHFQEAWKATVRFLQNHFKSTRSDSFQYLPRICLKGTAADSGGKTIIDIYRGENASRTGKSYAVAANTAFASIASTQNRGRHYLCNDIPGEVCKEKYINPRLNPTKAIHYCRDGKIQSFFRKRREICEAWTKCWVDFDPSTPVNCYRSTLVVPLTLLNNDLDDDFINSTIIGISRESEQTIYGFLCFDHPATNYFNDNDIDIGYICADLLSFHLINRQALIHGSQTVTDFCTEHRYRLPRRC